MRQSVDLSSAVNTIKLDIQDTVSNLYKGRNCLSNLSQMLSVAIQYGSGEIDHDDASAVVSDFTDIANSLTAEDWNPGNVLLSSPIVRIKQREVTDSDYDAEFETVVECNNVEKIFHFYFTYYYLQDQGKWFCDSAFEVDGVQVNDTYVLEDDVVGGHSICSIITNMNECLTTNDFLQDLCTSVRNPSNLNNVLNKWINYPNTSTQFKEALNDAISELDGTPTSILAWLHRVYNEMSNTTYVNDELSFSSTSFIVKTGFATVGQILAGALGAAVAAIGLVIGKVVAVIGMCLSAVISAISNAFENRLNPLISLKTGYNPYNDFLPIPVSQQIRNDQSTYGYISGDKAQFFRINGFLSCTRVFKNKGNGQNTNYESFLRCPLTGQEIYSLLRFNGVDIFASRKGLFGEDYIFNKSVSSNSNISSRIDPFDFMRCTTEYGQANLVMCHLALYAMCYLTISSPTSSSNNFSTALNAVKSGSFTEQNVFDVCYWLLDMLDKLNGPHEYKEYFYGDGYADWREPSSTSPARMPRFNWDEVINVMVPAVRQYAVQVVNTSIEDTLVQKASEGKYIDGNNYIVAVYDQYLQHESTCVVPEGFQQYDSPFVLPSYTGSGAITNIVLSVITIAITVAVAVAVTIAYKRLGTKLAVKKTQKLLNLKAKNDKIAADPTASNEAKNAAYQQYYKAVKRYNLTSWLYGGGTWSITNGWVDYTSSDVSSATLASNLKSTLSDTILVSDVDDSGQLQKLSYVSNSQLNSLSEESTDITEVLSQIKRLIAGI